MTPLAAMPSLAISSAYGGAAAAIVQAGNVIAEGRLIEEHGLAASLPHLVASLLRQVVAGGGVALVAVVVGPGSFTGVRSGLSLAYGVGLGIGVPVIGVSVAEALAEEAAVGGKLSGRVLWTAIHARRGRVFVDTPDGLDGYPIDALPDPVGRIAVCGNAANVVAGTLAARGVDVMLTPHRAARPVYVASVAIARAAGRLSALPALPLYVDLAEAKLPEGGLRRPPACVTAA